MFPQHCLVKWSHLSCSCTAARSAVLVGAWMLDPFQRPERGAADNTVHSFLSLALLPWVPLPLLGWSSQRQVSAGAGEKL